MRIHGVVPGHRRCCRQRSGPARRGRARPGHPLESSRIALRASGPGCRLRHYRWPEGHLRLCGVAKHGVRRQHRPVPVVLYGNNELIRFIRRRVVDPVLVDAGAARSEWLATLAEEHHNLRAALESCRSETADALLRYVLALYRFWFIRGHLSEGRAWAEAAPRAAGGVQTPLFARVLSVAASLGWQQGDLVRAKKWYEDRLAVWRALGDARGVQYSTGNLGLVAWKQGDCDAARALLRGKPGLGARQR